MRRFSFLQIFFTALIAGFAIALCVRIRSYRATVEGGAPAPSPAVSTSQNAAGAAALHQTPADTGTVEPVVKGPTKQQLREQLMRETQPQPQPAAKPQASQPQVQPKPQPAAPKAPITRVPPASSPPASKSQASSSSHSTNATADAAHDKKDPNSDTAPPTLLGIEFDPPVAHDGDEVRVIMTATDDMSGIKGISGTITSPTGKALQGFAGVKAGEEDRYIGRFVVPKNGEEGLWRVNVISMNDNASNSITLTLAQGTLHTNATLKVVSSQGDSTPPVLKSARAENRTMRAGEQNPIYIEAEDDKSGVNLVSAVFQSPNKRARIGAGCQASQGDTWVCELQLPTCIDCGDWQLEQVTLQDKANNLATYRMDNPIVANVKINIAGDSCDNEPPRLIGVRLDQNNIAMGRDPVTLTVIVTATDDACGVEGVSGQYAGPVQGSGGFFPFQKANDENTWIGRITLDPRAPRGQWRLTSIQLTDKGRNLRIYYVTDPLLVNAYFNVR